MRLTLVDTRPLLVELKRSDHHQLDRRVEFHDFETAFRAALLLTHSKPGCVVQIKLPDAS